MRRLLLLLLSISAGTQVHAQAFLKMHQPVRTEINTSSARQYLVGHTCKDCKVKLNNESVYVYPTGVFALRRDLQPGQTTMTLHVTDPSGKVTVRTLNYYFNPPPPVQVTSVFRIDYATITPKGDVQLSDGDTLRVKIKGFPGCQATWINNTPLKELPPSRSGGIAGFYEGFYVIKPTDSLRYARLTIFLKDKNGNTTALQTTTHYTCLLNPLLSGRTTDNLTYLNTSPEGDRLGPEKMGYLDENVLLHITGKQDDYYKVKLSRGNYAFIPEAFVDTATLPEPIPLSIVNEAKVWSDAKYDYVSVGLSEKLPYLTTQTVNPGKIIVDVHGAYSDQSAFIPEMGSTAEISQVDWQQVQPDVFRMVISLKHGQPWGYQLYYDSSRLTIRIKRPPAKLELKGLTIGLDAGHGGTNVGALGAVGIYEKQMTLAIVLLVKDALEKEGVRVLTTRTTDKFVANEDRLDYYRQANPDLLLSIHLNSSGNPIDVKGTATYYKWPFCQPLNYCLHQRMMEAGLGDFGNNADFNFILNQPTEFPDALIETLFISNPEDEMHVLDEGFRHQIADKIVLGLKDFLKQAGK
ncbi:AMIN domain-containing protein [Chitinophaga oryziterrae]|uniref:N-acetylmuramoyl-L-alanine amidase n=1 Tax=Chitinophaga oryziterrae TaxID=1031224 RepID=A0A6N8JI97_9BACT|nr:N-acetylmuramoyl-L-alanine amidase [Chitinophaga oryziterrae]MVT44109.1 AMIN domain-containing protein [Chitinophaga oryziterrae]